jgi:predicted AAA+ superfamily ATPase
VAQVVRPFSAHNPTEIVSAPKVYGFDTGMVCYFKGWRELRTEDMGLLWEHYVLNELTARLQAGAIRYWRDKQGHELDFIIEPRGGNPVAIKCKWRSGDFSAESFRAFFRLHDPQACYVVCSDVGPSYRKKLGDKEILFVGLPELIRLLEPLPL